MQSMNEAVLKLVESYPSYKYPGHRDKKQSDNSGEEFRDSILIPFINQNKDRSIVIDLSGAVGYPPSFLDEAFGGCIRNGIDEIQNVKIIGVDEIEMERIKRYITNALKARSQSK
jgi:hypothetical protein